MDSGSVTTSEKKGSVNHTHHVLNLHDVDVAATLDSEKPLDPEVALRLRYANMY